ncbi:putative enzyme related to lactoylglutathione lyase [Ruegeria denitrificans]|uniref:Putative enzyme related to lactoylglutathione lyase n=1 Tax=Ruegeria denitrificans TaxID=1715692 RepID=A0A0P1IK99_9RHOB|nr:VOC family protein [Ruegeria denitrificans]CUK18879.1 putative enzyme related to lactoylglutathione lyase [Ruegeria denitrificans]
MKKKPATLPRGYRTCTASLAVADVPAALQFYESAFNAKIQAYDAEEAPSFAAIKIGNSMLFVTAGWGAHVPVGSGTVTPVGHHMYVEDVDIVLSTALENGANLIAEANDTYWGERCATVADPFGHIWTLATRLENLKSEDISERRKALFDAIQDLDSEAELDTPDQTEAA